MKFAELMKYQRSLFQPTQNEAPKTNQTQQNQVPNTFIFNIYNNGTNTNTAPSASIDYESEIAKYMQLEKDIATKAKNLAQEYANSMYDPNSTMTPEEYQAELAQLQEFDKLIGDKLTSLLNGYTNPNSSTSNKGCEPQIASQTQNTSDGYRLTYSEQFSIGDINKNFNSLLESNKVEQFTEEEINHFYNKHSDSFSTKEQAEAVLKQTRIIQARMAELESLKENINKQYHETFLKYRSLETGCDNPYLLTATENKLNTLKDTGMKIAAELQILSDEFNDLMSGRIIPVENEAVNDDMAALGETAAKPATIGQINNDFNSLLASNKVEQLTEEEINRFYNKHSGSFSTKEQAEAVLKQTKIIQVRLVELEKLKENVKEQRKQTKLDIESIQKGYRDNPYLLTANENKLKSLEDRLMKIGAESQILSDQLDDLMKGKIIPSEVEVPENTEQQL